MPEECKSRRPPTTVVVPRRALLTGVLASAAIASIGVARSEGAVNIGVTPLFLDSDIRLLSLLRDYLAAQLGRPIELVKRRTYQEITAMLLSGQLDAAWICDDPYVQHQDQFTLLAVPLYRGEPLYQTYVIANGRSKARTFDDIRGTVHAFSDPDSTSGYLVTRYLLALRRQTPAQFFRASFFTYGHRNVVRAVASDLAESGSIDGYVFDVMRKREPDLIGDTRVIYQSERLGFPPIVGLTSAADRGLQKAIADAFQAMPTNALGRDVLAILDLDGFTAGEPSLYTSTLEKWRFVKAQA